MGLTTFFITIVGGLIVFMIPSYFLILEAQKVGFPLDNTLAGVIVVVVSIGLLLLWPVSWLLRFLYYKIRKKEMPPVRPSLEIPKWLLFIAKFAVTCVTLVAVFTLFSVAFLKISTIGYEPVVDGVAATESSSTLGVIKLTHLSEDALPLRDIEVVSGGIDSRWSVQAQSEELWLVSAYLLEFPEWIQPLTEKFGLKPVARLGTLSSMAGANMSVQPVLALGEETVTEYMLLTAGKYVPLFLFKEIQAKPVVLGKVGEGILIKLSNGILMIGDGGVDDTSSSAIAPDSSDSPAVDKSGAAADNTGVTSSDSESSDSGAGDAKPTGESNPSGKTLKSGSGDDFGFGDDE